MAKDKINPIHIQSFISLMPTNSRTIILGLSTTSQTGGQNPSEYVFQFSDPQLVNNMARELSSLADQLSELLFRDRLDV